MLKPVSYYELDVSMPIHHKKIDYERINEIGLSKYVKNEFRPQNLDYLFFTKNKEWESEQEFRVIYFSDNIESEYFRIDDCIERILLGADFDECYLPAIRNSYKGIDLYKLDYKDVRLVTGTKLC